MKRVFGDDTAFLNESTFSDTNLLDRCVVEIRPFLVRHPEILVYGKMCQPKRNTCFFSDESSGYKYSGNKVGSAPLTNSLRKLIFEVNQLVGSSFNGILVNEYLDGSDYIGAHSDDETGLDPVGVVSVSYGAERNFRIRNRTGENSGKVAFEIPTAHGAVLHMGGEFQKLYTHEIPVQKKISGTRISFTFRRHRN